MLPKNTGNRYAFTTVAAYFVTCSLLTAVLMLVQHRGHGFFFRNGDETIARGNASGSSRVHVRSKFFTSGQLPFVPVVVVATSAFGWADRRARIRTQFPKNMKLLPQKGSAAAILKFAIGTQGLANDQLKQARAEAAQFSDSSRLP